MSDYRKATIYRGHVLDALRAMPAAGVHCAVTSPPYWGLRDYGLEPVDWPDGWRGQRADDLRRATPHHCRRRGSRIKPTKGRCPVSRPKPERTETRTLAVALSDKEVASAADDLALREMVLDDPAPLPATTACRGCGARVYFVRDRAGKWQILDARAPVYVLREEGNGIVAVRATVSFVSHFSTCPKAGEF